MQLPNGYQYRQPETGWVPQRYSSFSSVCDQLIAHRQANPYLMQLNGWTTDRATVEMEVDNFNARFAQAMGGDWLQYVEGGPALAVPFQPPPPPPTLSPFAGGVAAVKKLAAGAALLFDWEESGQAPVDPVLAVRRAAICSTCPKNSQKEFGEWFTGPLSESIRKRIGRLSQMNLATPSDPLLGTCSACLCPLRLKVHTPMDLIQKRLKGEERAELDARCWILSSDQ